MILIDGNKATAKQKARDILNSALNGNGFRSYETLETEIEEAAEIGEKYQITDREKAEIERHLAEYLRRIGKILK